MVDIRGVVNQIFKWSAGFFMLSILIEDVKNYLLYEINAELARL